MPKVDSADPAAIRRLMEDLAAVPYREDRGPLGYLAEAENVLVAADGLDLGRMKEAKRLELLGDVRSLQPLAEADGVAALFTEVAQSVNRQATMDFTSELAKSLDQLGYVETKYRSGDFERFDTEAAAERHGDVRASLSHLTGAKNQQVMGEAVPREQYIEWMQGDRFVQHSPDEIAAFDEGLVALAETTLGADGAAAIRARLDGMNVTVDQAFHDVLDRRGAIDESGREWYNKHAMKQAAAGELEHAEPVDIQDDGARASTVTVSLQRGPDAEPVLEAGGRPVASRVDVLETMGLNVALDNLKTLLEPDGSLTSENRDAYLADFRPLLAAGQGMKAVAALDDGRYQPTGAVVSGTDLANAFAPLLALYEIERAEPYHEAVASGELEDLASKAEELASGTTDDRVAEDVAAMIERLQTLGDSAQFAIYSKDSAVSSAARTWSSTLGNLRRQLESFGA